MGKFNMENLSSEKVCPVCGKIFYVHSWQNWVYKFWDSQTKHDMLVCSWHCMRKLEKDDYKRKKAKAGPWNKRF